MSEEKEKHAGGRPSKYTPDMIEKAKEYLDVYEYFGEVIPTVVGLCRYIDRAKSTVYEWVKHEDKKSFSDIVKQIDEIQELNLVNKGLSGEFNPQFGKMILTRHGYSEKQDINHTSSDGSMSPTTIEIVSDD